MIPRKLPRNAAANGPPARPGPAEAAAKPIIAPMQRTNAYQTENAPSFPGGEASSSRIRPNEYSMPLAVLCTRAITMMCAALHLWFLK
uniref:Uncharacterized protein n=1 Tax=Arundo donax TaxID=35708 RepID=A0A0A9E7C5_ARUDO